MSGIMNCPVFHGTCSLERCNKPGECQYSAEKIAARIYPYTEGTAVSDKCPPDYYCSPEAIDQRVCLLDCAKEKRCLKYKPTDFISTIPLSEERAVIPNASVELKTVPNTTGTAKSTICHWGLTHIGDAGKARIWIGKETAVGRRAFKEATKDFALIVSLIEYGSGWGKSDNKGDDFLVTGNVAAKELLPGDLFRQDKPIPFLHVSWPDFGAVSLGRDWWAAFVQALKRIDGDVVLYCVGGHGRTGTATSILAVLCEWVPPNQCPVLWVRQNYCREVVESKEQIAYIEEITGRYVVAGPAKNWSTVVGSGYSSYGYGTAAGGKQTTLNLVPKTATPPSTPYLSKNKYKALVKKVRKQGGDLPLLSELEDKDEITYGGNVFQWDAIQKEFYWLEEATDEDGTEVQRGTGEPGPDTTDGKKD